MQSSYFQAVWDMQREVVPEVCHAVECCVQGPLGLVIPNFTPPCRPKLAVVMDQDKSQTKFSRLQLFQKCIQTDEISENYRAGKNVSRDPLNILSSAVSLMPGLFLPRVFVLFLKSYYNGKSLTSPSVPVLREVFLVSNLTPSCCNLSALVLSLHYEPRDMVISFLLQQAFI